MTCARCSREIPDEAKFCQFCGAAQHAAGDDPRRPPLRRSQVDRQIAGVCGGIASYIETDPVFVRLAWVILTIFPGAIFFGVLAYLAAWLIIPDSLAGSESIARPASDPSWRSKRLQRSASDRKVGGVCGGIAEYFAVDSTAIRMLWVVLSIFPGAIVCGVLIYVVAWVIMPAGSTVAVSQTTASGPTER